MIKISDQAVIITVIFVIILSTQPQRLANQGKPAIIITIIIIAIIIIVVVVVVVIVVVVIIEQIQLISPVIYVFLF